MVKVLDTLLRKVFGRHLSLCIKIYSSHVRCANNRFIKLLLLIISIPVVIFMYCTQKVVPFVLLDVTTACTLNCKECSHFIPAYRERGMARNIDTDTLLRNIDLLLPHIDKCLRLGLMGGETFLHKELYKIIDRLVPEKKIKHIRVVTNGTIIPTGENLRALKHKKISVRISNYGELSTKSTQLLQILKENGIPAAIDKYQHTWVALDGLKKRGFSLQRIRENFSRCGTASCKALYEGKLWVCPVAYHGNKLELTPECDKEYIDLRTCTGEEFWSNLKRMYKSPDGISACSYCLSGDPDTKEIPAAEQAV